MPADRLQELDHWRDVMYTAGLIGAYPDGIGFGNISRRWDGEGRFLITGSATGNFEQLEPSHYCLVTEVIPQENRLTCQGPILASSESMSHAVIYRERPEVNGVIHIHHLALWKYLLHKVPTTDASAPYGSPEMAASIVDLLETTDLPRRRIFVMEGHREGIFAFGETLESAASVIFAALENLS
ncbi:MAG TPA: class II aldolase/adducin family protein [Flavilitoribacter sp.]|nr:class II aldolase/adducin family protein [Flavilitoribacter sp.]